MLVLKSVVCVVCIACARGSMRVRAHTSVIFTPRECLWVRAFLYFHVCVVGVSIFVFVTCLDRVCCACEHVCVCYMLRKGMLCVRACLCLLRALKGYVVRASICLCLLRA